MDFYAELAEKGKKATEWLEAVFENSVKGPDRLVESMRYSALSDGKRIRPVISMAVCEMLGGEAADVMPFACGIELIHAYSLIHDDLPALDNDDMRRGKPTNHIAFDEATAILSGDALQALAFDVMSQSALPPMLTMECIRTVAIAAGSEGMAGGQVCDMQGTKTLEEYSKMCNKKTGALIMASAVVGALAGRADIEQYQAIGSYAKNIGLAFQLKDDILDKTGDSAVLGKATGSDEKAHKYTFVDFLGIEKAEQLLEELVESAKFDVHVFGEKSYFLQDLANYIAQRER